MLKYAKYFAHPNKNLTSWSINNAKINTTLAVLIIYKVVKCTTFSKTFDKKKPNASKVKGKNGHVYPINLPN